ncbi:hypothetical protein F4679DRAFT_556856 [Xylaria curta]|nr:hypothetical protein F4679DRAFT_556856 [Xylaria curta]
MADNDSTWEVVSYHINVGLGDGSIHLLIDKKPAKIEETIAGAVMIDGGMDGAERMKDIIREIEREYWLTDGLQFDSIVVTHWDKDHYGGLFKLLADGTYHAMKKQDERNCPYIKASTVFYCPDASLKVEKRNDKPKLCLVREVLKKRLLCLKRPGIKGDEWITLCNACCSLECIGKDLFSGKDLFLTGEKRFRKKKIKDLLETWDWWQNGKATNRPIFLCVGADMRFIYDIEINHEKLPGDWSSNKDLEAELINAASLMCLLIWRDDDPTNESKVRISLYTGGDAEEPQEKPLLDWFATSKVKKLDCIKAGHHGSKKGTHENFTLYNPDVFIFSVGEDYGHPSFSLIYFIMIYSLKRDDPDNTNAAHKIRMFSTRKPYWLLKSADVDPLDNDELNISTVLAKKAEKYQLALQSLMRANETVAEVLQSWFPDCQAGYYEVEAMLTDAERKLYQKCTKHNYKMEQQLVDKVKDYNNALKPLHQKILSRMNEHWPTHGKPSNGSAERGVNEVKYIKTVATAKRMPEPVMVHYEYKIDIRTTFQGKKKAADIAIDVEKPLVPADGLAAQPVNNAKRDRDVALIEDQNNSIDEDEVKKKYKNNHIQSLKRMLAARAAVPGSPITLFASFFTRDVDLRDGKFNAQDTRATITDSNSRSLGWFNECGTFQSIDLAGTLSSATRFDLATVVITATVPKDGQPFLETLRFSTATDVLQAQFGTEGLTEPNVCGYNSLIQGMLFGLDNPNGLKVTLRQFLDLTKVEFGNSDDWMHQLLDHVPLELPTSTQSERHRSGIWFQPHLNCRTIMRIQARLDILDDASSSLRKYISDFLPDLVLDSSKVIATTTRTLVTMGSLKPGEKRLYPNRIVTESSLAFEGTLKWSLSGSFLAYGISVAENTMSIKLRLPEGIGLSKIFQWLSQLLASQGHNLDKSHGAGGKTAVETVTNAINDIGKDILFREVSLTIGKGGKHIIEFVIIMEVKMQKGAPKGNYVALQGSLRWSRGSLEMVGQIWPKSPVQRVPLNIHPYWTTMAELMPSSSGAIDYISIPHLIDESGSTILPKGIPDRITKASVNVTIASYRSVSLSARIQCGPWPSGSEVPPLWLDELSFYFWQDITNGTKTILFRGLLNVPTPPHLYASQMAMQLGVELDYDSDPGLWLLTAEASNISMANLYAVFPRDGSNLAIMDCMSQIQIKSLTMNYKYEKGFPSRLDMDGQLLIGSLRLSLNYFHEKTDWRLNASLAANQELLDGMSDVTVNELLEDLLGDQVDSIPDFVLNLKIPLSKLAITLNCWKHTIHASQPSERTLVVFSLLVSVGDFSIIFAQLQDLSKVFPKSEKRARPIRLLRFALTGIPKVQNIPIVHELPQPFDAMEFLWLSADLTREEADVLNQGQIFPPDAPLLWKDTPKKGDDKEEASKLQVLLAGSHFQLSVLEQNRPLCIIDHVFGVTKPSKDVRNKYDNQVQTKDVAGDEKVASATAAGASASTTSAPMARSFGGLSIRNVGLKMGDSKTLDISLDAVVLLGPLGFSLIGFTIHLDLSKVTRPSDILNLNPHFSLSGLAVEFSLPPAKLAGMFAKDQLQSGVRYRGGLALGVGVWDFLAAGVYEENSEFKSVFVFVKLNGPLISFGFAEVNGLVGGFGYNSLLRFPTITEVTDFPFVSLNTGAKVPKEDIMLQFADLTDSNNPNAWIKPQKDSLWLAAGLGLKAFQMLDVQAVLAIDLSTNPKIGIFAEAIAVVPKGAAQDSAFLFLDLGMAATVDTDHGLLTIAGQLTPYSYIFDRSCKLTGGFVLAYFFESSGHDGDWVFSIGGYHPAYQPPTHYPSAPPRVRVSWSYDSNLSITGEAYFAITPQVCMGGGRLDAIFKTGCAIASFSAYADFLIHYQPFQFMSSVGVAVYVSARLGKGWFSVYVSLEVSATLDIHGPPFAGTAHIHLWFMDISVRFGPDHEKRRALTWPEFYTVFKQSGSLDEAQKLPDHILSITDGRLAGQPDDKIKTKEQQTKDPEIWLVRGPLFKFELMARFPIRSVIFNGAKADKVEAQSHAIFSTPMQLKDQPFQKSELVITIKDEKTGGVAHFNLEPIVKPVPGAMWNQYDSNTETDQSAHLSQPITIPHLMGINFLPMTPTSSSENIPPFSLYDFNSKEVNDPPSQFPPSQPSGEMKFSSGVADDPANLSASIKDQLAQVIKVTQDSQVAIARADTLDIWESFRARFSAGGSGLKKLTDEEEKQAKQQRARLARAPALYLKELEHECRQIPAVIAY